MSDALYYLRPDVVSAPRVARWYAWTYLIDYRRAFNRVRGLGCEQVFVYALGLEPWLAFISSIEPNPDSAAVRSTRALISACDEISIPAERLYGRAEG